MLKAAREAKQETNWTCPVPVYEDALARYIDSILRPGEPNPFVEELDRLARRLGPFGFRNSLGQVALKLTAPGVPDIYQGCEQWNFSLVDPDNRRPVDFEALAARLTGVRSLYEEGWPSDAAWAEMNREIADGRLKQLVTWRLLQLRRSQPELFRDGSYLPLSIEGPAAEHAVAFARHRDGQVVLVVAARLTYTLCSGEPDRWGADPWRDTSVNLETDQAALNKCDRWLDWMTGREVDGGGSDATRLALARVFGGASQLPFAVLVPAGTRLGE
jgi:(1->4)-alpha-D-glucan 1-alpha-D-glucosylmutase